MLYISYTLYKIDISLEFKLRAEQNGISTLQMFSFSAGSKVLRQNFGPFLSQNAKTTLTK